jgi:cholera toxin transcriptional activator
MDANSGRRLFRFGAFEADEHTGELRKQGRRLPLQGQPLQVLLLLLDRPGELVSRTEIQQRLWSDGTFVDFDHGLNTAINKIREALGDSASSPRFVETLARRGYRFIAPVEAVDTDSAPPQAASVVPSAQAEPTQANGEPKAPAQEETSSPSAKQSSESESSQVSAGRSRALLATPEELPQASRRLVRTLFLLLQVMYLGFYAVSLARLRIIETIVPANLPTPIGCSSC